MNGLQALARRADEQPRPMGLAALASAQVSEVRYVYRYSWAWFLLSSTKVNT